jgi:hypothetical protein
MKRAIIPIKLDDYIVSNLKPAESDSTSGDAVFLKEIARPANEIKSDFV